MDNNTNLRHHNKLFLVLRPPINPSLKYINPLDLFTTAFVSVLRFYTCIRLFKEPTPIVIYTKDRMATSNKVNKTKHLETPNKLSTVASLQRCLLFHCFLPLNTPRSPISIRSPPKLLRTNCEMPSYFSWGALVRVLEKVWKVLWPDYCRQIGSDVLLWNGLWSDCELNLHFAL